MLELREESHLPFFLVSSLRKVSYLAVSVRLTVKQVRVNECVVQYDWSMIFKGPSNDAIHNRYVITNTTQERLLKRTLHTFRARN